MDILIEENNIHRFIDEKNNVLNVPKDIDFNELESYKKKCFFDDGSSVFKLLFQQNVIDMNIKDYKFLIVDFGRTNDSNKLQIIELLKELIENCDVIQLKGKMVFVYYNEIELDFRSIIQSINYDFFSNIKVYQSGKIYIKNKMVFIDLFECFSSLINSNKNYKYNFKINEYINNDFYSNTDLIIILMSLNYGEISKIRSHILNDVVLDSQYENIINSMFNNDLNVSNASRELYMHRNTLNNKLEYIRNETGFNIQRFKDAMAMYWLINAK